jgi:uncharacterized membrane protein YuzA (DUF378 family)
MPKQFKMNPIDWTALALVVVGAINWGLVGVAHFVDAAANWNLVNILFDSVPAAEFGVYLLVGLAGLYGIYFAARIAGVEVPEPEMEPRDRDPAK